MGKKNNEGCPREYRALVAYDALIAQAHDDAERGDISGVWKIAVKTRVAKVIRGKKGKKP